MLRDVVVHITNEQPIMVDLVAPPTPSDVNLICRNVRTMAGKKPVFVDRTDSTFAIPLAHIRFVEMPRVSVEAYEAETAAAAGSDEDRSYGAGPLARLGWLGAGESAPLEEAVVPAGEAAHDGSNGGHGERADPDELDDDLLRRIREA